MELKIYDTRESVAEQFASYLEVWLKGQGDVHLALSGGSTPKIVFEELSIPGKYDIAWEKVQLYWGDERCVPPSDKQSNYKMTRDFLLSNIDIPSGNVHRILGENDPAGEAQRYGALLEQQLPSSGGTPVFDMVILGMGEDGHTASIFPHEIELWDSEHNCEVAVHPESGQKRITITGKVINKSREVVFLVTGAGKEEKVTQIIHKRGDYKGYPAALVAPESGQLSWFLDREAATGL